MRKTAAHIIALLLCSACLSAQPVSEKADSFAVPPPAELIVSPPGGFYPTGPVTIEAQCPGGQLYYTLDGSTPTRQSNRYTNPFTLTATHIIRFLAAYPDERGEELWSHTYFIGEPETNFPIVSIGIDPPTLFDPFHGLFVAGPESDDSYWKKPGANFWSKREVAANVEIFEPSGLCTYRSESGFRLFGGMSRLFPQKSIALVARDRYGDHRIKHEIFGEQGEKKFKFLVLRNGGSDFGKSHFRDALIASLTEEWDIETQDYRPSHVYINGEYWGIYNIREKINRYFIDSHFKGVENDSIDLMEHRFTVKYGSAAHYRRMISFLEQNDLSIAENFAYLNTLMDIDNFLNYQIAQIYIDNQDAGGNIRYWRPQTPNGRWRWILYDTDWGFGLHDPNAYQNNSLAFHTAADGPSWPNPPWSTFILRKLLENEGFRARFVNRFSDHLATSFEPKRVHERINTFYHRLKPEIPRHFDRWKLRAATWEHHISRMHTFAEERPRYMRMHLMEHFQTGPQRLLSAGAGRGGQVVLNSHVHISQDTLTGTYFERYPVTLKAVAYNGFRFSHWEGRGVPDSLARELQLQLKQKHTEAYAVFEPYQHPLESQLVINEVSPKSGEAGDWLELYNGSSEVVDLSGWSISDCKQNELHLPKILLKPREYLVITEDAARLRQVHPGVYNLLGGMKFGLNKRHESIALYASDGAMVDSISYWAPPVDSAFTLSLLLPDLNNADPENWAFRPGKGTPNSANPYYVESTVRAEQARWVQLGLAGGVLLLCGLMLALRFRGIL